MIEVQARKVALVGCALSATLAWLWWLHHGGPSSGAWWGLGAGLGVASVLLLLLRLVTRRQGQLGRPAGMAAGVVPRLGGMDYVFWFPKLPFQPLNMMSLILVRPGVAPDGSPAPLEVDRLRRHVGDRLGALPAFRWRVVGVPFGLGHPVYVEDPDFDIARHVDEHVLAAPGTAEVLDAYYLEQSGRSLDRRRPLWRLTLVHGLADGRQAVVLTIHHCVVDGFALINTLGVLLGELGAETTAPPTRSPTRPASRPGRGSGAGRLLVGALAHQARTARRLPALVRVSRAAAAAVRTATAASPVAPLTDRDTPVCPLNPVNTGSRTFARTELASEDLEEVGRAGGVTLNDVTLALVAGSLRDYLCARGSLPTRPLVAGVPVGLDRPGAPPRMFGNRVSDLHSTLATDLADPWERLLTIGAGTARAKRLLVVGRPGLGGEWLDQLPPLVLNVALRHYCRRLRRDSENATTRLKVVVTHVRAVFGGTSLAGAPLETFYTTGAGSTVRGVYVALASYSDRLLVSILCVDAATPPPGELAGGLHRALAELLAAARSQAVPARSANTRSMEQL